MGNTQSKRKIKLAKYLARNEANPDEKPSNYMDEVKAGMEVIEEFCQEKYGKSTRELTEGEATEFYEWCEQKTPSITK